MLMALSGQYWKVSRQQRCSKFHWLGHAWSAYGAFNELSEYAHAHESSNEQSLRGSNEQLNDNKTSRRILWRFNIDGASLEQRNRRTGQK